ncbi:hypothetical protein [Mycobacterium camsae]|nr:hypothetical protein [Mycobacterium gordonae]
MIRRNGIFTWIVAEHSIPIAELAAMLPVSAKVAHTDRGCA